MTQFRFVVAVVAVLLLATATQSSAQIFANPTNGPRVPFDGMPGSFPGCPTCGLQLAVLDTPAPYSKIVSNELFLAGWACDGVSPDGVDRVSFAYQDPDTLSWHYLIQPEGSLYPNLARPDVAAAPWVQASCPHVSSAAGWALIATNLPPVHGLVHIALHVWRGPYFRTFDLSVYLQ
jgi:hypothetical protein